MQRAADEGFPCDRSERPSSPGARALAGLAVMAALSACRTERAPAPPAPIEGFELLSPGVAPRRALRYQLTAGTSSRTTLRIQATPLGSAAEIPTVRFTTETELLDAPDGVFPVRVVVLDAQVDPTPDGGAAATTFNDALAQLRGTELRANATGTGKLSAIELKAAAPGNEAQLQSLSTTMQQLAPELPLPDVGVGARWAVERPFEQTGLKIESRTIYELLELTPTTARVRTTIELTAPDQTVRQGELTADLSAFSGHGEGELTIDLTRLTASGTSTSSYRGHVTSAGQAVEIGMTLVVSMSAP